MTITMEQPETPHVLVVTIALEQLIALNIAQRRIQIAQSTFQIAKTEFQAAKREFQIVQSNAHAAWEHIGSDEVERL